MKKCLLIAKRIIAAFLFAVIVLSMFTCYSNVMRERDSESNHITGADQLENVDVFFLGSSVTETSWQPYRAWLDYGITSYDFASNGQMTGSEVGFIHHIEKKHRPKLYVIDIRDYLRDIDDNYIASHKLDNMSHSWDRLWAVWDTYKLCTDKQNIDNPIKYFVDLLSYQEKRDFLADSDNWEYINNDVEAEYKGFKFAKVVIEIDKPEEWPETKKDLDGNSEKRIRHLLEYTKKHNIPVLYTLNPYSATYEQMERANTMADIIAEYDGTFLNICGDYAPYEVDYKKDFYNARHMNVYGAEKYTNYIAEYILSNYEIEDHRGQEDFLEWDEESIQAMERENEIKTWIEEELVLREEAYEYNKNLADIDEFSDWFAKADVARDLSLFAIAKGDIPDVKGIDKRILTKMKFYDDKMPFRHWISSEGQIYNSKDASVDGMTNRKGSKWTVTEVNDAASIVIEGNEYSPQRDGINIVAWDDNNGEVVDIFVLTGNENGELIINR